MDRKSVGLHLDSGRRLYYFENTIARLREELESFLVDKKFLNTEEFANRVMYTQEIKANNLIEGYHDSIDSIESIIQVRKDLKTTDEKINRVLNLFYGYAYASKHNINNKEQLDFLYSILSEGLLDEYELDNRKGFYRDKPVYIFVSDRMSEEPFEGMKAEKIEQHMDYLFEYINRDENFSCLTDYYIKAAIIHFYFVHIHPYFDVNGRTSRTVSMSYLLHNKAYPFIIINRGINFEKNKYYKTIRSSEITANLTPLLQYLLNQVSVELEKEYLTILAEDRIGTLSPLERQSFNYILSMNSQKTLYDFLAFYNRYNDRVKSSGVEQRMITPLLEKGLIKHKGRTKRNNGNYFFDVNTDLIDYNPEEFKRIILKKK